LSGLLAKTVFSIRLFHSVILENVGINLLCFLVTIAWPDFEKNFEGGMRDSIACGRKPFRLPLRSGAAAPSKTKEGGAPSPPTYAAKPPLFFQRGRLCDPKPIRSTGRPSCLGNAIYTALPDPLCVPTTILLESGSRGFKHQPVCWRVFSLWIGTTPEKRVPCRFFILRAACRRSRISLEREKCPQKS
jgi:hypothetical protein